jgi:hypothetical protein
MYKLTDTNTGNSVELTEQELDVIYEAVSFFQDYEEHEELCSIILDKLFKLGQ